MVFTKEVLKEALASNDFYIQTTAKALGISRTKLYNLISHFEIDGPAKKGVKPLYKINIKKVNNTYYKMIARCHNPEYTDYKYYGGRGISVCKEWRENRDIFAEYYMKLENYGKDGYTLDRIDNSEDYKPGNVRLTSKIVQANNTRRNKTLEIDGETYTIAEFSRKFDLGQNFVIDRIKLGYTPEEIISVPRYGRRSK